MFVGGLCVSFLSLEWLKVVRMYALDNVIHNLPQSLRACRAAAVTERYKGTTVWCSATCHIASPQHTLIGTNGAQQCQDILVQVFYGSQILGCLVSFLTVLKERKGCCFCNSLPFCVLGWAGLFLFLPYMCPVT